MGLGPKDVKGKELIRGEQRALLSGKRILALFALPRNAGL
jgi:hypothetical protein